MLAPDLLTVMCVVGVESLEIICVPLEEGWYQRESIDETAFEYKDDNVLLT